MQRNPEGGRVIVGTCVDVIEIARIERLLADRGEHFERRVFTPNRIEGVES
jgi:phosphopantetheinyl transferase (holo-ACP synthase)